MSNLVMGLDPGSRNAAWAVVNVKTGQLVDAGDVPVLGDMVSPQLFRATLDRFDPRLVIIEKVGAMPKQGLSSTFKFGYGAGLLYGCVATMGYPVEFVTPAQWKRDCSALGKSKDATREMAIKEWPRMSHIFKRKKDGNRADAAMIARYGIKVIATRTA